MVQVRVLAGWACCSAASTGGFLVTIVNSNYTLQKDNVVTAECFDITARFCNSNQSDR